MATTQRRRRSRSSPWASIQLAFSRLRDGRTMVERPPGLTGWMKTLIATVIGTVLLVSGLYLAIV